ncbi:MAG: hypothetical protein ACXWLM_07720, partial [Myxococcales bacterium]
MPTISVFDGDPVHCSASLKGKKFKDAKKVEFVFNEGSKEVDRAPAELDVSSGAAKGKWEKSKGPDKPGLVRKLRYHVEIDGKKLSNQPEEIHVYARTLEIVAKHKDDKPFEAANAKIEFVSVKNEKKTIEKATDDKGKIEWPLPEPGEFKISWEKPYFLLDKKWIKNKGIEWEAKIEKIAPIKLVWPESGKLHKQWVNLDAEDAKPENGMTVKVKVGPGKDGPVEKGKKIYLKAEFGKKNSERTPMAGGKKAGEKLELNKDPDDKGEAVFEVPVGSAGGDTIEVSVGSTDACKDSKVTIETWRRIHYELMAPKCMEARLVKNDDNKWDLHTTTKKWAKDRLAAVFVSYDLRESHIFADNLVTKYLYDGDYLGKPAGTYYVLGSPNAYNNDPATFGAEDKRCIFVRCCDVVSDAFPAADIDVEVTRATSSFNGPQIFKIDPGTGDPSISDVTWEAVTTGLDATKHPAFDAGVAKSGALPDTAIELVKITSFKVKLTGDAAALAGAADATHCPIKVKWKWKKADPYNGSANGLRQLMNLGRPLKPVAATVCHELGHSMGMTVLE